MHICTVSSFAKEIERIGHNKTKIFQVGLADFDHLTTEIDEFQKNEFPKNNKILFCTSPLHENGLIPKKIEFEVISKTIKKILKNDKYEIALKIHPLHSSLSEYKTNLEKNEIKINIYQKENIVELFKQYDILIAYDKSSIILHGILFKRRILFLNYFPKNYVDNVYHDKKITEICENESELIENIKILQSKNILKENYNLYVQKHIGKFDGKNSERIAELIINLYKKNLQ